MSNLKILFLKPLKSAVMDALDIPLGIMCLSSYIKQQFQNSIETRLLDLRFQQNIKESITKELKDFCPDIIGISMMTYERTFLDNYLPFIRQNTVNAKIIIGGAYASSAFNEILKNYPEIQYVIIGEGEIKLYKLIQYFLNKIDIKEIDGIVYRKDSEIIINSNEKYIQNLDELPFPDYTLINLNHYCGYHNQMNFIRAEKIYTHVVSSRACPFKCIYCHNNFGKTWRARSPQNFVNEIIWLYNEYNVREFHIIDDIFNYNKKRMKEILNLIINSGIKIKIAFPNALRGDMLDEDDIILLKKAGCYMITFAIESASQRIQKLIKKNLNIEKVINNIRIANSYNLITKCYFMIGFPTETVNEIYSTVNMAIKSKLDMASFFILIPQNNSEVYDVIKEIYGTSELENINTYYEKSFYEKISGINLRKIQKNAYLRFYSPLRLLKLFFKIQFKKYFVFNFLRNSLDLIKRKKNENNQI